MARVSGYGAWQNQPLIANHIQSHPDCECTRLSTSLAKKLSHEGKIEVTRLTLLFFMNVQIGEPKDEVDVNTG